MATTHTIKLGNPRANALRDQAAAAGMEFRDQAYMQWQARGDGVVLSMYESGKLVIQGREADAWLERIDGPRPPGLAGLAGGGPGAQGTLADGQASASGARDPGALSGAGRFTRTHRLLGDPLPDAWIGIDETGKGDYFGPLVVVAARVSVEQLPLLEELGAGDSKAISDRTVRDLARQLAVVVPHEKLVLMPAKYNELYARFGNLNKLLAWAHATASEALLERAPAQLILSDQFTPQPVVPRYFKGPARAVRYSQRTRAEDDAAVACASVIARAEFLWRMKQLEEEHGVALHPGAGAPVLAAGRRIVADGRAGLLPQVAKLHFKTTQQIGG